MSSLNKWLEPYRRSFMAIKNKLLSELDNIKDSQGNPLITDKSEGNILVLIISMFSAIAEILHFYIDQVSRESFLPSARKYSSLINHARLVDYHIKGATAAKVDVTLSRTGNLATLNLSCNSSFLTDSNGNEWRLAKDYVFPYGATLKNVTLIQHSYVSEEVHSSSEITNDRYLFLNQIPSNSYYEEGSMELKVGNDTYTLVDTFAKSSPEDKHFMVEISEDASSNNVMVVFGDGVFGYKPMFQSAAVITLSYFITAGSGGNINANGISTSPTNYPDIQVRNSLASGSGSNYEDFDTLKRRIHLSVKTLDVAISKEDFKDLAMTIPEVGQAAVEYECGRKLNVYISDIQGEPAPDDLCTKVRNYILQHCPLTTWVYVKPVGKTSIILSMNVTGNKSYKENYIRSQIIEALTNKYSAANSQIGGSVRLSDIYALIDNLPSVDYLRITKFYLKPWPKVYRGIQLNIDTYDLKRCDKNMEYLLEVDATGANFLVYSKYNRFEYTNPSLSNLVINDTKNGVEFTMSITNSSALLAGYKYSIYITQNSLDYEEPGYNIPSFSAEESNFHLEVNEVL